MKPLLVASILMSFFVTGIMGPMPAYAQDYHLPAPGVMVNLSPAFAPPVLKGIKVHPDNPFRFEFILDKGDSQLGNQQLKDESSKLIKYFLASLTIPEKDLWVNLSPYEKDRIIPNSFGLTEMGRDLLAEDYMLKQITASLIYPEDEVGKKFWKRIYEDASKKYGTTNIPVNTFNKVWIVPEKAVIYENAKTGTAYVVTSKLKVMLEQDYLSLQKHAGIRSIQAQIKSTNQLGSQIVREIIIPKLTTEVNENKNFAHLRQVYNSLILATWYKKKIKYSILEQVYADKNKVAGVSINDPQEKQRIYERYLRAFKKGVYNYIKEDFDPVSQETIARKYFSGGMDFAMGSDSERIGLYKIISIVARLPQLLGINGSSNTELVNVEVEPPNVGKPEVSLNGFIQANRRLLQKVLLQEENETELRNVLKYLGLINGDADFDSDRKIEYHRAIITKLTTVGYDQTAIDLIKGQSNSDPRLDTAVTKQSGNPRGQSIIEAISNSIDALGGTIGQFGMGVKQIIDWLSTAKDRVDVYSLRQGGQAHQLHIIKPAQGQDMVQLHSIDNGAFQKVAAYPGAEFASSPHGTVIQVSKQQLIPLDTGANSLRAIEQSIHERFAIIQGINIITRVNQEAPRKVNGWEHRRVIVGNPPSAGIRGAIYVELNEHGIRIVDNGTGMDPEILSRMFVPREGGTKTPESINAEGKVKEELKKVGLIHDFLPEKVSNGSYVSFARNGEIITRVNLNNGIIPEALLPGEIILELGGLIEVNQARDKIIFSQDHSVHEEQPMTVGVLEVVKRMLESSISDQDKLRIANSIVAGMEGIVGDNESNAYIVRNIKAKIKKMMVPLVAQLKAEGYVILPYEKSFQQLEIANSSKVIWLNESIFDWQGIVSLEKVGGIAIDRNRFSLIKTVNGEQKAVIVVCMPFKKEVLAGLSNVDLNHFNFSRAKDLPIIEADGYVVIPSQFQLEGRRFVDLIEKDAPTQEESTSLAIQAQLITTMSGEDVPTSYEIAQVRQTAHMGESRLLPRVERNRDHIDSDAVNGFLTKTPPNVVMPQESEILPQVPADARLRYTVKDNKIVELGTGIAIQGIPYETEAVENIEYVGGEFYYVSFLASKMDSKKVLYTYLYHIKNNEATIYYTRNTFQNIEASRAGFSPRRNYLYRVVHNTVYLLNLLSGEEIPLHFVEGIINIIFSNDERYIFIETTNMIYGYDLKEDRYLPGDNFTKGAVREEIKIDDNYPLVHYKVKGESMFYDFLSGKIHKGTAFVLPNGEIIVRLNQSEIFYYYDKVSGELKKRPYSKIYTILALHLTISNSLFDVDMETLEPGTLYKHPLLELIIDKRQEGHYYIYDIIKGTKFQIEPGDTVFRIKRDPHSDVLQVIRGNDMVFLTRSGVMSTVQILAVDDNKNPRYWVWLYKKRFWFESYNEEGAPISIDPRFNHVSFDGRYFVFIDPNAAEAVYLDPQNPKHLQALVQETAQVDHVSQNPDISPNAPVNNIPSDARAKYYLDPRSHELKAVGSSEKVQFKDHSGNPISVHPIKMNALGDDLYLINENDSVGLYHIRDGVARRQLGNKVRCNVTPEKNYYYWMDTTYPDIFHFHSIERNSDFDINIRNVGRPVQFIFSRDERVMFVAGSKRVQIIDLRKGEEILTLGTDKYYFDLENSSFYYLNSLDNDWFFIDIGTLKFEENIISHRYNINFYSFGLRRAVEIAGLDFFENTFKIDPGHLEPGALEYRTFPQKNNRSVDLLIDRMDPDKVSVWDLTNQIRLNHDFPKSMKILRCADLNGLLSIYFRDEAGDINLYSFLPQRSLYSRYVFTNYSEDRDDHPNFVVSKINTGYSTANANPDNYYLLNFGSNSDFYTPIDIKRGRYTHIFYDGAYFIFVNQDTGETIYMDPHHPENLMHINPTQSQTQHTGHSKSFDLWVSVLAHREAWIAQAREAYMGLWNILPESARYELADNFKSFLPGIYALQENAIRDRYEAHAANDDREFKNESELPLDIMARRIRIIVDIWQKNLESGFVSEISELSYSVQNGFYSDFLNNTLSLLSNPEIAIKDEQINADLIQALTFGWKIRNTQDLKDFAMITRLLENIRTAQGAAVNTQTMQTMVRFLSRASQEPERAKIVEEQLNRILKLSPRSREQVIRAWYEAFDATEAGSLYAALSGSDVLNKLGKARDFVVFLTHRVEMIPHGHIQEPEGTSWVFNAENNPDERMSVDQIAEFNANKPINSESSGDLYTIADIINNAVRVRTVDNRRLRLEIAQYVNQQREAGGYAAEIAQNSSDAGANQLVVRHYYDDNLGKYVEEIQDDGRGAPFAKALALLIPKSNKNENQQRGEITGFFGTGKFTMYAGVDRVEIITNNGQEAYVFVLDVDRKEGRVFLTKIGRISNPSEKPTGVTIRRISDADNVLPELEQMLSIRAWKAFAGMAQNDRFRIAFQREEGSKDLEVKGKKMLSETDFIVQLPTTGEEVNFGKMRIWSTQDPDMPIQVIDKKGLRVDDLKLKERFLDFVPEELRHYIKDLRIVIQIPLPLIQNRSSFEREEEFLPQIQKYIAVELYKALVAKRLREENFFLNPVPRDFETNEDGSYNTALVPQQTPQLRLPGGKHLFDMVHQINDESPARVSVEDMQTITNWFNGEGQENEVLKASRQRSFISFITQIEVDPNDGHGRNSLLMRRIKTQSQINAKKAQQLAKSTGVNYERAIESYDPHSDKRVALAESISAAHRSEPIVLKDEELTNEQKSFLDTARKIAAVVGFKNVYLVWPQTAPFAGQFVRSRFDLTMYLNADLAHQFNRMASGNVSIIHKPSDTVVHELGHLFETMADRQLDNTKQAGVLLETKIGRQDFTHDGRFISFMRLMAAMALTPPDMALLAKGDNSQLTEQGGVGSLRKSFPKMIGRAVHSGIISDESIIYYKGLKTNSDTGGIDLTPTNLHLQTRNAGQEIKFHIDAAQLAQLQNAPGFVPVIINIQPLKDLYGFLGIAQMK